MTVADASVGFNWLDADARLEILEAAGCAIWVYDGDETRYVNEALAELTGYSRDELLQPGAFRDIIHPDSLDLIVSRGKARVRGEDVPDSYEVAVITKARDVRTLSIHARRLVLSMGPVSLVTAVDITQLRDAERTIRVGSDIVRELLHSLPAHVITTDVAGKPTFVNSHWLDYTGLSAEVAMQSGTASVIHPDDARRAAAAWAEARRTEQPYDIDYRVLDRHRQYRWQTFRIRPVRNPDGDVVGWTSASVDVHEARELAEQLGAANAQLVEANQAKDEVLGLVSHELRSPLTAVLSGARLLHERAETLTDDDRRAVAADVESHAQRLQGIIENMLVLSRGGAMEAPALEPVLLTHLVRRVVDDFRRHTPGRPVALDLASNVSVVLANATFVEQILRNLLTNANKYAAGGSGIDVRLALSNDETSVELSVGDRGPGIHEDEIERVFDAFYRSTNNPRGTFGVGLGLTVCRRLAELQGGSVTVRNREGGGCEFQLSLPAMAETAD